MKYFYHMPILLHGILGLQFIPTPSVNGNQNSDDETIAIREEKNTEPSPAIKLPILM